MPAVSYSCTLPYLARLGGRHVPGLRLTMRAPGGREAIAFPALLDSGAAESLFDGGYLQAIGVDLLDGQPRRFQTTGGQVIDARRHRVELIHEQLGPFDLEIAFSTGSIVRNLLGRDFFNLTQIGFREKYLTVFVEPRP